MTPVFIVGKNIEEEFQAELLSVRGDPFRGTQCFSFRGALPHPELHAAMRPMVAETVPFPEVRLCLEWEGYVYVCELEECAADSFVLRARSMTKRR